MKILLVFSTLTHYHRDQFNKLNEIYDLEIIMIISKTKSKNIGEAVYETHENVKFKLIELEEIYIKDKWYFMGYKGLSNIIINEKPDVIITLYPYLRSLFFDLKLLIFTKLLGIKVLVKDIPFRLERYDLVRRQMSINYHSNVSFVNLENRIKKFAKIKIPRWILSCLILYQKLIREIILRIHLYEIKFFYNMPDAYLCYIDEAKDIYGSYGVNRDKIFISRNSPDTDILFKIKNDLEKEKDCAKSGPAKIIHVGRLVKWKKVDLLIHAFSEIKKVSENIELIVIGNGPELENLKKLAGELGLLEYIDFAGGIYDPAELGHYLLNSSVYVLAGMGGLSINDAMCFGLPIVCSTCDGTEKYLVRNNQNGFLFLEDDLDDLVDKIKKVIDNLDEAKRLGNNSVKIIEEEVNIHSFLKIYVNAIEILTNKKIEYVK